MALLLTCGSLLSNVAAQTTQGKDFWVTFMRMDFNDSNNAKMKLTISSNQAGQVRVENPYTGQGNTYNIKAGLNQLPELFNSNSADFQNDNFGCYSTQSELVKRTAVHIMSDVDISVFASSWKDKSFDATNVLPTAVLQDEYYVQCYTPSDHNGADKSQGSHFAVIATEDNTYVDITLGAATKGGKAAGSTFTTPQLNKGEVYYVWTNKGAGPVYDLSGTHVVARGGKKIAVFQGNPHTNLPYLPDPQQAKDRDHLYSQAMPIAYWGNTFAVTSSLNHHRDVVRVLAIEDGTTVTVNGNVVHTFDFATNPKRTFEFQIGDPVTGKDNPLVMGESCMIHTSCPCAVHLFTVSNRYEDPSGNSNGDPCMIWVSPIEQRIQEVTFSAFTQKDKDGKETITEHYVNIVTDNAYAPTVIIDGQSMASFFQPVATSSRYSFARIQVSANAHTIKAQGGFIAHAYGFGEKASYGYSCGSAATKTSVTIDGNIIMDDSVFQHPFCINEPMRFEAKFDAMVDNISWDFGDGVTRTTGDTPFDYHYDNPGWYDVFAYSNLTNECTGRTYRDTMHIAIRVTRPDTIRKNLYKCENELPFVYGDKTFTKATDDTVTFGCERVEIVHFEVGDTSHFAFETTARDVFNWNGVTYEKSGTYIDTLTNMHGCDSIVTATVTVITCLDMDVENPQNIICADDKTFFIPRTIHKGEIKDAWLLLDGQKYMVDFTSAPSEFKVTTNTIPAGQYNNGQLLVVDKHCGDTLHYGVQFTVQYAQSVFAQKWQNVLAVYNKDYNGGYDFVAFQWFLNGTPIEGATSSIYHTTEDFTPGDEYQVLLTRSDGVTMISCPKTIVETSIKQAPEQTTEKKWEQNQLYIIREGQYYNILGEKIQ